MMMHSLDREPCVFEIELRMNFLELILPGSGISKIQCCIKKGGPFGRNAGGDLRLKSTGIFPGMVISICSLVLKLKERLLSNSMPQMSFLTR